MEPSTARPARNWLRNAVHWADAKPEMQKSRGGYRLKARHVIHTVGPIYRGGVSGEPRLLASCYRRCLEVAHENRLRSLAFPSISTGAYGYPIDDASKIAVTTTVEQLEEFPDIEHVIFCLFSKRDLETYTRQLRKSV